MENVIARLTDRLVRKADHSKSRQAGADIHLDLDGHGVHADQGDAAGAGEHQRPPGGRPAPSRVLWVLPPGPAAVSSKITGAV